MITNQHKLSLEARGISEAVAKVCGIESFSPGSIKASLGSEHTIGGDGFSIPYMHNGKACLGLDGVAYTRYRIYDERAEKDLPVNFKKLKYMQRAGAGTMPFVPSIFVPKSHLVITEGELKAISACAAGIPTIAIPGVDLWFDASARVEGDRLTSSTKVHPLILEMTKNLVAVVVLADSDAHCNAHVRQTMLNFCEALRKQAGAAVIYKSVPPVSKDEKLGLDDWIALAADDVIGFIARAVTEAVDAKKILDLGGYVPLGYQGVDCVVWSRTRKAVITLSASALSSSTTLKSVAGSDWCKVKYGLPAKEGDKVRVDWEAMTADIIDECTAKGFFSHLSTRGAGVWKDSDGVLIVNTNKLWRADGEACNRVSHDFVYEESLSLDFNCDAIPATKEDVKMLMECLKTWHWKNNTDAVLLLGWICHGFLCGALEWRTHANLTGGRGTGKSTLMKLIAKIFGAYALLADGDSSEAGIRQKIGNGSRPILIDEGEPDGCKIYRILQMFRAASSGSGVLRGTQDQSGTEYTLRTTSMVGGIVPPQLNAADASRFLRLELEKQQTVKDMHILLKDDEMASALGQALWMRMILNFGRFNRALAFCKTAISQKMDSSRAADTIGNVLAASWIALMDDELTLEKAIKYLARFDLTDAKEQHQKDDSLDCLDHLLGSVIRTQYGATTVIRLMEKSLGPVSDFDTTDYLGNYGLKVVKDGQFAFLKINANAPHFKNLFNDTKWQSGAIRTSFMRINGAKSSEKAERIGGMTCRPVIVPVSLEMYEEK